MHRIKCNHHKVPSVFGDTSTARSGSTCSPQHESMPDAHDQQHASTRVPNITKWLYHTILKLLEVRSLYHVFNGTVTAAMRSMTETKAAELCRIHNRAAMHGKVVSPDPLPAGSKGPHMSGSAQVHIPRWRAQSSCSRGPCGTAGQRSWCRPAAAQAAPHPQIPAAPFPHWPLQTMWAQSAAWATPHATHPLLPPTYHPTHLQPHAALDMQACRAAEAFSPPGIDLLESPYHKASTLTWSQGRFSLHERCKMGIRNKQAHIRGKGFRELVNLRSTGP